MPWLYWSAGTLALGAGVPPASLCTQGALKVMACCRHGALMSTRVTLAGYGNGMLVRPMKCLPVDNKWGGACSRTSVWSDNVLWMVSRKLETGLLEPWPALQFAPAPDSIVGMLERLCTSCIDQRTAGPTPLAGKEAGSMASSWQAVGPQKRRCQTSMRHMRVNT